MSKIPTITIQRLNLPAGQLVGITPPYPAHGIVIGNGTADDVRIYSQSDDQSQYLGIAAGYSWSCIHPRDRVFRGDVASLYINAVAGGVVTIEWV